MLGALVHAVVGQAMVSTSSGYDSERQCSSEKCIIDYCTSTSYCGDVLQVYNLCVASGINLFDTADSYGTGRLDGKSEQLLVSPSLHHSHPLQLPVTSVTVGTALVPHEWLQDAASLLLRSTAAGRSCVRPRRVLHATSACSIRTAIALCNCTAMRTTRLYRCAHRAPVLPCAPPAGQVCS